MREKNLFSVKIFVAAKRIIPRKPRTNKAGEIARFSPKECKGSRILETNPRFSAFGYAVALRTK